jgi:Protein of unknown function (DUF667)
VQLPHPTSLQKALGLTGRFLYLELKSPAGAPFSLHFDFGLAERGHGLRVSLSNLFKSFNSSSGFVIQAPLDLHSDRWTVVCVDLLEIFARSKLFPASYNLEGSHSLKSMTLCANIQIRGVYTSDNEYDFLTLPSEMRFKFAFDQHSAQKWLEHFDWKSLPTMDDHGAGLKSGDRGVDSIKHKAQIKEEERSKMQSEINQLLSRQPKQNLDTDDDLLAAHNQSKRSRIGKLPEYDEGGNNENFNQFNGAMEEKRELNKKQ